MKVAQGRAKDPGKVVRGPITMAIVIRCTYLIVNCQFVLLVNKELTRATLKQALDHLGVRKF